MPRAPSSKRAGVAAAALLGGLVLVAALLAGAGEPNRQNLAEGLAGPSLSHPLGQDKLGRDQLARVLNGARVSLTVGFVSVGFALIIGVLVGTVSGYAGGPVDFVLMGLVDVLLAFPGILLAIAMAAVLGPSLHNVIVALAVIGWTGYARLVRGEVLALREREHVEAAVALGVPTRDVLLRHVLPLLVAPLAVQATFGVAGAVVAEASLSFLGVGVQAPTASWGTMLNEGRVFVRLY